MTRLKDWPSRFAALVDSARLRPFAWGTHDCCTWAASAVEALTGLDPAAGIRGTYADEAQASKVVEQLGGLPVIAARGGVEISPRLSTTGDVGLVRWPDATRSLGVFGGQHWLCVGEAGLVAFPRKAAVRAWGVGRE